MFFYLPCGEPAAGHAARPPVLIRPRRSETITVTLSFAKAALTDSKPPIHVSFV